MTESEHEPRSEPEPDLTAAADQAAMEAELAPDEEDEPSTENEETLHREFADQEVREYFRKVGRTALLTAEEEVELAKRIETGLYARYRLAQYEEGKITAKVLSSIGKVRELLDAIQDGEQARVSLAEANLRLVVFFAKRYLGSRRSFMELIQEGNLGLMDAVQRFDYTRGYKFSSYAGWWIQRQIRLAIADSRTTRIPAHVHSQIVKVQTKKKELADRWSREPTLEELAAAMEITPKRVLKLLEYDQDPLSLDQNVIEQGKIVGTLGEIVADDDAVKPELTVTFAQLGPDVEKFLEAHCSEREKLVLRHRFGFVDGVPWKLEDIGPLVGNVTKERVRQIQKEALGKLAAAAKSNPDFAVYRGGDTMVQPYAYLD